MKRTLAFLSATTVTLLTLGAALTSGCSTDLCEYVQCVSGAGGVGARPGTLLVGGGHDDERVRIVLRVDRRRERLVVNDVQPTLGIGVLPDL